MLIHSSPNKAAQTHKLRFICLNGAIHDTQTNSHIELAAPTGAPNHSCVYVCVFVFVEFRVSVSLAKLGAPNCLLWPPIHVLVLF
jgi:hypothetical protein